MRFSRAIAWFVAAAVVLTATGTAAHATFPGRRGRIALGVSGTSVVLTADADGSHRRRTFVDARELSWAPDGRHAIYARGYGEEGDPVMRADALGNHARPVLRPNRIPFGRRVGYAANDVAWSPRGRRFAMTVSYAINTGGEGDHFYSYVGVFRFGGHRVHRLARGADPAWTPSGRRIVFTRDVPAHRRGALATHDLLVMHADGTHVHTLRAGRSSQDGPTADWSDAPDVSPEGRRVVVITHHLVNAAPGSTWAIEIIDLDTGHALDLTTTAAGSIQAVTWSPDGRRIIYLRIADQAIGTVARTQVRTVRPDGTGDRLLFRLPSGTYPDALAWQPVR